MKEIEEVVADNIKRLMNEFNVNQVELSKIAGVSESTVGKWVLKKSTPRMGAIQKISDHFNIPKSYILKEDEKEYFKTPAQNYNYLPTAISAGLPLNVDSITEAEIISIPDAIMGKWAGHKDIFITKINGDSMDRVMPDGSLIAVKPITLDRLRNGDMVVFSNNHEYSVKYYYRHGKKIVFKPSSNNPEHFEQHYTTDDDIQIHGKVVVYIVELD